MKFFYIFLIVFIISCNKCPTVKEKGCPDNSHSKILSAPISEKVRVGKLGFPLGTVIKIEGSFYNGDKTRLKALSGIMLMKVGKINGKIVKKPVLLRFIPNKKLFPNIKDNDNFSVYAYETGKYTGVPTGAFKYILPVTTTGFHFRNYLVLLSFTPLK